MVGRLGYPYIIRVGLDRLIRLLVTNEWLQFNDLFRGMFRIAKLDTGAK